MRRELLAIALSVCYQFIDSASFGGPVLWIFSDTAFLALLLYWFATSSAPKRSPQTAYLLISFVLMLPYSYIFDSGLANRLSIGDRNTTNAGNAVLLDDRTYQKELQRNRVVFQYQEDQPPSYNDIYANILGKRIPRNQKVLDERVIQASMFLIPKEE